MLTNRQGVCLLAIVVLVGLVVAVAQDGDVEVGTASGSKTVEGDYSKSQNGIDDGAGPDFPIQDFWIKPIAIGIPDKLPKNANTSPTSLVFYNTRNQLGGSKHPDDSTIEEVDEHHNSKAPHHHRRREMHQRIRDREEEMEALTARVTKRRHVAMEDVMKPQALLVEKQPDRMRDEAHHGGLLGGGLPSMEKKKKRRGGGGRRGGRRNRKSRSLPAPDGTGTLPTDIDEDNNSGDSNTNKVDAPFKTVLTYIPFSPNSPIHDITSDHMEHVLSHGDADTGLLGGGGGGSMQTAELVGFRATSPSDHRPVVTFLKAYFSGSSSSSSVFPDDVIHTTGFSDSDLRSWFNTTSIPLKHAKALAIINHAPQLRKIVGSSIATRSLDVEVEAPVPADEIEEEVADPNIDDNSGIHHGIPRHHDHRRHRRAGGSSWRHAEFGGAILLSDYHINNAASALKEALYVRIAADSTLNGRAKEALTTFVERGLSKFQIVSRLPTPEETTQHEIETELREKAEEAEMDQSERARFRQSNELKRKQQRQRGLGGGLHRRPHHLLGGLGGEREVDHTNQGNIEVTVVAFAIVKTV